MRIGIDFHAAEQEGTGNCTYARNLVESLVDLDEDAEFFLYGVDIRHPYYETFSGKRNVAIRSVRFSSPFLRFPFLGLQTLRDGIDILHATYYGPPIYRGRLILTVHDLSYLHCPECFSHFERIKDMILIPFHQAGRCHPDGFGLLARRHPQEICPPA